MAQDTPPKKSSQTPDGGGGATNASEATRDQGSEAHRFQRKHVRVQTNFSISLRFDSLSPPERGRVRNLSLGGVFINTDQALAFGQELDLEFTLPHAQDVP